jgi:hypothetical protein
MRNLHRAIRELFSPPAWPARYEPAPGHAVISCDRNTFFADIIRRARAAHEAAKRNPVADDPNP